MTGGEKEDGAYWDGVYGTYVHGIFDADHMAERIVDALLKKKGIAMEHADGMDYAAFKETQYQKLSDTLREYLDMEHIYQMLEESDKADCAG